VGVVYLGQHTLLGRRAAIKVLLPEFSARPEIVNRFFHEARAVTTISDPGIVQVFDFGHHIDGSAFIVMELLEGEPMDKRLDRIGRFGLSECLRFMQLMCASLAAVHARGIVHRDLKPENIFIVRDPGVVGGERAKLLDFGIAKLSTDEPGTARTRIGALLGTPMYMSPEQCRGAGDVDHHSDIYTIACVMFTMLTGRPPFDRQDLGELIVAHLREPPPLASSWVPEIPDFVDQILQRCLRKSPADRFGSMTELGQALAAAEHRLQRPSAATPAIDPATALAQAAPAPLPVQPIPSAVLRPQPTTLGTSAGESTSPAPVRARSWGAAVSIGAVALASIIVLVALRPGDGKLPVAASPRLSFLTVSVSEESRVDGLTLTRDGKPFNPTLWNRALPVDGGDYIIAGRAPGHEEWQTTVHVAVEGAKASVEVPRFKELMSLPRAQLAQYDALLDVENQLMHKYAANAAKTSDWVSWLVDDALPDLFKLVSIASPLL
jgi:serine/threonine-protein kinase